MNWMIILIVSLFYSNCFADNFILDYLQKNKAGSDEIYRQLSKVKEGEVFHYLYFGEYDFNSKNGKSNQAEYIILKIDSKNEVTQIIRDQSFSFGDKRFSEEVNEKFYFAKLKNERKNNPKFFNFLKKRCAQGKCNSVEQKFIQKNGEI